MLHNRKIRHLPRCQAHKIESEPVTQKLNPDAVRKFRADLTTLIGTTKFGTRLNRVQLAVIGWIVGKRDSLLSERKVP